MTEVLVSSVGAVEAAVATDAANAEDVGGPGGARVDDAQRLLAQLRSVLDGIGPLAVAVSGGVDSMTLAVVAHRLWPGSLMLHAVSAAVPPDATARVQSMARREGWQLEVIDAGEFANEHYRANPVNRCFHCKTQLYSTIGSRTQLQVVSGANTTDLGEYRPGLDAARDHGVRHPYVEAGIDKAGVRAIARHLQLDDVAELPSAPCLSSRVETGIRIEPPMLRFVHAVERLVARELSPLTVRCRIRADGVVVELDDDSLARLQQLDAAAADALRARIAVQPGWQATRRPGSRPNANANADADSGIAESKPLPVRFEPYRNGSAFVHG